MSAIAFGDELVRDYLLFRGFLTALKAFDSEVKADKDRQFRVCVYFIFTLPFTHFYQCKSIYLYLLFNLA